METQRSLLRVLADWWDQRQTNQRPVQREPGRGRASRWLPTPGTIVFTLSMIGLLLWAQTAGALPLPGYLNAPDAPSTGTIAYQGRLADASGNPLTAVVNMEFRLYTAATGGTWLWHEPWTGPNAVQVSDGLFNVMLGSLAPIPQNIMTGNSSLWLGISAGTDDEMTPRVQLGSVPFAVQALTVPDGSVTTAKIANGAVSTAKLADTSVTSTKIASGAVSTVNLGNASVTSDKLADRAVTASKVGFPLVSLYRPNLLAGGQCRDLIADLQQQGFTRCVYVASPGPGYAIWYATSSCSDAGQLEPNLWQKDSIWRVAPHPNWPVYVKGTYEDQMPYLTCSK